MMPKKRPALPKVQVIIDYRALQELLAASYEVQELREETHALRQQMSALRLQFTELMEKYREYQD